MTLEPIKLVDRTEKRTADLVVHTDRTISEILESGRSLYPKWFTGDWSMTYKDPATNTQIPVKEDQELSEYLAKGIEVFYWNANTTKARSGRSSSSRAERATRAGRKAKSKARQTELTTGPAKLIDRALALLIDMVVLSILAGIFGGLLRGRGLVVFLPFVYYAMMESSSYQASIGKMMMGLKVINLDGDPVDLKQAMIRSIVKVMTLPLSMLVYLIPLFTKNRQGLHDMLAKTVIVNESVFYKNSAQPRRG